MLVSVARGGAIGVAPAQVAVEVLGMVLLEESLDLLGEEGEEVRGGLCDHELLGDGDLVKG